MAQQPFQKVMTKKVSKNRFRLISRLLANLQGTKLAVQRDVYRYCEVCPMFILFQSNVASSNHGLEQPQRHCGTEAASTVSLWLFEDVV